MIRLLPIVIALLAVCVPLVAHSHFLVNLATLTVFSAFLGQCWNISGGFGGLTSFGHAAFFGVGAHADAIIQTRWGISPWASLPLAVVLGALLGAAIGFAASRAGLRGSYFALVTLAVAEVLRVIASASPITQGGLGILIKLNVTPGNFQFSDDRVFYGVAILMLVLSMAVAQWLTVSRFGTQLAAVRENEDAARALGVAIVRTKSAAMALSGGLTALGGVLYVQMFLYVDPNIAFGADRTVEMLLVAMIGGAGTVWGPVLGAILLHVVADTSRVAIDAPGFAPMLYGVILLFIVGFLPKGVAGLKTWFVRA
jgi:branched-chain amino acid transport system permease protein